MPWLQFIGQCADALCAACPVCIAEVDCHQNALALLGRHLLDNAHGLRGLAVVASLHWTMRRWSVCCVPCLLCPGRLLAVCACSAGPVPCKGAPLLLGMQCLDCSQHAARRMPANTLPAPRALAEDLFAHLGGSCMCIFPAHSCYSCILTCAPDAAHSC